MVMLKGVALSLGAAVGLLTAIALAGTGWVQSSKIPKMDRSQVEKISKALADETRLMIFEAISAKDHVNCSELVAMRGVTPATVSHHLKVLTEAGLVECKREGQFVCSRTVPGAIDEFTRTLTQIAHGGFKARKRA
jgi:ArsR family transcriptional regulator, arsenate/arsenite/antimonite-responsive transcriptional repressor